MGKFSEVKRDGHTGEWYIAFTWRKVRRRIWITNGSSPVAGELAITIAKILRERKHRVIDGPRGSHSLYWLAFDYLWQHAERHIPGGPKSMLQALSTQEAIMTMRLRRFFEWRTLGTVKVQDMLDYQGRRLAEEMSPHTVRNEIYCLFRILRWAGAGKLVDTIHHELESVPAGRNAEDGMKYAYKLAIQPRRKRNKKPGPPLRYVPELCRRRHLRPDASQNR